MKYWILLLGLLASHMSMAENAGRDLLPVPDSPVVLEPIKDNELLDTEVKTTRKRDSTIEEYRRGGFLYAVKVTPAIGPSYYIFDESRDSAVETKIGKRQGDDIEVPKWELLSW